MNKLEGGRGRSIKSSCWNSSNGSGHSDKDFLSNTGFFFFCLTQQWCWCELWHIDQIRTWITVVPMIHISTYQQKRCLPVLEKLSQASCEYFLIAVMKNITVAQLSQHRFQRTINWKCVFSPQVSATNKNLVADESLSLQYSGVVVDLKLLRMQSSCTFFELFQSRSCD